MRENETVQSKTVQSKTVQREFSLREYCKSEISRLLLIFVTFVLSVVCSLYLPIIDGKIIDRVIGRGLTGELFSFCAAMVSVMFCGLVFKYISQLSAERFGQNVFYRISTDEFEKLHSLDFAYFARTRTGDIMNRLTSDADAVRHFLSWSGYQFLDCIVMFAGSVAIMLKLEWRLALALSAVAPVLFYLTRRMSVRAKPLFSDIRSSLAKLNSTVEENIEGNRPVKAYAREEYEISKFDACNEEYMECNIRQAQNSAKYIPLLDGFGMSLQIITLALGGFLVIRSNMTLGTLVSFNSYLWMINTPIRKFGWLVNDWQRFNASCAKIRTLMAEPCEEEKRECSSRSGRLVRGDIAFENVSFAFPDKFPDKIPDKFSDKTSQKHVLKNISFSIPAGSRLGILGSVGSGKTVLANLIASFYEPSSGRILIDGIDLSQWSLTDLRSQINIVSQENFLFSQSVANNIAFGKYGLRAEIANYDDNSDEKLLAGVRIETGLTEQAQCVNEMQCITHMARMAEADNFVRELEDRYDTIVGERGTGLSGGQKQRLSLARALVNDPAILILDDTTSAVDMKTEALIHRNLRELKSKTFVIIASRVSSVKDCDLILFLDSGQIVERGTHEQLLSENGLYRQLYDRQSDSGSCSSNIGESHG
ncbi:MAG: ABC transporter ATP-binding protein [Bifidobacteriaceae bacterium]|nr:ABC transporter ATP-binding protein [Bifidobacteriaceae bacterium]